MNRARINGRFVQARLQPAALLLSARAGRPSALCLAHCITSAVALSFLLSIGGLKAQTANSPISVTPNKPQEMTANVGQFWNMLLTNQLGWCGSRGLRMPNMAPGLAGPGSCPIQGISDIPANRDACIPTSTTPIKTIRLRFNVLAFDDGTDPTVTQDDVDGEVAQLNADYAPWRVQFVSETAFIPDSRYRFLLNSDIETMQRTYADQPDRKINIFVITFHDVNGLIAFATFPWDPDALGPLGGIVAENFVVGYGSQTLTHEIGHTLGLWHTFTGVSEVDPPCSECYERADGVDGDTTGDYCSDTPPTPLNPHCFPPGGIDPCSGTPWGPTAVHNYMGYGGDGCWSEFTPQQAGRMHCWISERLTGWLKQSVALIVSATPDTVKVGGLLTYSLTISNFGTLPIDDLTLTNTLPDTACFVSSSSDLLWAKTSNTLACTISSLTNGGSVTGTIVVIPTMAGVITNTVVLPNGLMAVVVTTVTPNDPTATPALTVGDVAILEGNSGTSDAVFSVCLTPASDQPVTVKYATADGTANAGSDYVATNGTLVFIPGETSKSIIVKVNGDTLREPNETFYVQLTPATNALNARTQAQGTIINDDFLVDLVMTDVQPPPQASTGGSLVISNTVLNAGSENIQSLFEVGVYLSTNAAITTNDLLLATRRVSGLKAGQSNAAGTLLRIDRNLLPGPYYVAAIADPGNVVNEVDETNNMSAALPIAIVIGPDLAMTAVNAPLRAGTFTSFVVTNTVQNLGTGNSGPFGVGLYLSTDQIISADDAMIARREVGGLAPGEIDTAGTLVTIPSDFPVGTYYVGAIADITSEVIERAKTNNALAGNVIEIVGGPDLVVAGLSAPFHAVTADQFIVTNTIYNLGMIDISARFEVGFYLSLDDVIATNDLKISSISVVGLAAESSYSVLHEIRIPPGLVPGKYYFGAIVDDENVIPEVDESNNALTANAMDIVAGPDLTVTQVSGPSTAGTGTSITITNTIQNVGTGYPGPISVGLYLSTDALITTNDLRLGGRSLPYLAPGQSGTEATVVRLGPDLAPGIYYFGVIADEAGEITEITKANNALAGDPVEIAMGPDLIVTAVSGPGTAGTGGTITITNTVRNVGMTDIGAAFSVGLYLSTDAIITTNDLRVGTRAVAGLGAGQISTDGTASTIDAHAVAPGLYYLGAIADPDGLVGEVSKTNNALAGNPVQIVIGPDLVVTAVSGPATAPIGGLFDITSTVFNAGTGNAALFRVGFYLSVDQTITTNDQRVGFRLLGYGLLAGQSDTAVTQVRIESYVAPGTYYLGAIADYTGDITESNESNNALTGNVIEVVVGADLAVTRVSGPSTAGTANSITITNTIQNVGTGYAGAFSVGLYLSTDALITTNDLRLGGRSLPYLMPGETSGEATVVNLSPDLAPGIYYFGVIADEAGEVTEITKANNALAGDPVEIAMGPDLIVTAVSGPGTAGTGGTITITNTVRNMGMTDIGTTFSVGLYLSTDAIITTNDLRVGTRAVTGLGAGQASTAITLLATTGLPNGTYYFGAIADNEGVVSEVDKANNSLAGNRVEVSPSKIRSVRLSGIDVIVSFTTFAGRSYRVERTDDLSGIPLWRTVAGAEDIIGNGGVVSVTDFSAGLLSTRYYRVRLLY